MEFDLVGWLGGAYNTVANTFTNQAEAAKIQSEYIDPVTPVTEAATVVQPYVPTVDKTGVADYSGGSQDTSIPSDQKFVESYVASTDTIDNPNYIKPEDLGDSKTQAMVREGYSPLQALAMQEDVARAAGDLRSLRSAAYYKNEGDKAKGSNVALSSEYHHDAMASGLPQEANPFEYVGDLSLKSLYKSQGDDSTTKVDKDTGLGWNYKGSMLQDANIITKAARTGDMGGYQNLGQSFSSNEEGGRFLGLPEQQYIGRNASATAGLAIDEGIMEKYKNPRLLAGAGFDLTYKEAKPSEVKANPKLVGVLDPAYMKKFALITDKDGKVKIDVVDSNHPNELLGSTTIGKPANVITGVPIINAVEMVSAKKDVVPLKETPAEAALYKPENKIEPTGYKFVPHEGLVNLNDVGNATYGMYGPFGATGLTGISGRSKALYTNASAKWTNMAARKPRPSYPSLKRSFTFKIKNPKLTTKSTLPKADPSIVNIEAINSNVMPKSLGNQFKFMVGTPDIVSKFTGTRGQTRLLKVKGDALGLIKLKNVSDNIKISNPGSKKIKSSVLSNVVNNIDTMISSISKPLKLKKM